MVIKLKVMMAYGILLTMPTKLIKKYILLIMPIKVILKFILLNTEIKQGGETNQKNIYSINF